MENRLAVARSQEWVGVQEREVDVTIKGQHQGTDPWKRSTSWLYQCLHPGCDMVLQFCEMLPMGKSDKSSNTPDLLDWSTLSLIVVNLQLSQNNSLIKKRGLPWWRSGWESACQCRGHGFEPWSGRIPHAAERLGPWATIAEPARLEPVLRNERGRDSEGPAHRDEEWPPLATTRESPRTETKTQHSQK